MYAIIRDGGKQYKVAEGDVLRVERRADLTPGDALEFSEVLLVRKARKTHVGTPLVEGATVKATVQKEVLGRKTLSVKFRRRKDSQRRIGHRQKYTEVKIEKIATTSRAKPKAKAEE